MGDKRRMKNVYFYDNGMVMVFDQFGEQMPEYQGRTKEMREKIFRDMPPDVEIVSGRYKHGN